MSETLHNLSNPFEYGPESDSEIGELAVNDSSRAEDDQDGYVRDTEDSDDDGYDDEEYGEYDYDEDYEDENDDEDDYDEYEEENWGEERSDFNEENLTIQEIDLPKKILERYTFLGELPHGIAVMGGVARSIAREIITGEREPIRDIDLVNITDEEGNSEVDGDTLDELSWKFMPDDYSFGHGISNDTLDNYFRTRDFTINQCLIKDGKLIVSDFAYNDFQENIIRPTYYEHRYEDAYINGRLFLKALMMRGVLSQISSSIPLIEDAKPPEQIGTFNIALFLNKAMSRGAETARIFTEDLADWDIISEDYAGRPVALAKMLLKDVYSFNFRPSGDERFKDVQECKDMDGFFIPPSMSQYYASDPVIRRALAEYEDDSDEPIRIGEERVFGYYTQAEYDDINRSRDDDWDDYDCYDGYDY